MSVRYSILTNMPSRNQPELYWIVSHCEFCGAEFRFRRCRKVGKRFCNTSCSNSWQHNVGERQVGFDPHRNAYSYWLEKFGKEEADKRQLQFLQRVSLDAKRRTPARTLAASAMATKQNKKNVGKTYEERFGVEKAAQIKHKMSIARRGRNNPAFGKVYANGGHSIRGTYKGTFFRSLSECSYMKYLENIGFSLDKISYEPFSILYEFNGEKSYRPDFLVGNRLVEIKPASYKEPVDGTQLAAKFSAARKYAIEHQMTFEMLRCGIDFPKLAFDTLLNDPEVVLDQRSIENWKKHDCRK